MHRSAPIENLLKIFQKLAQGHGYCKRIPSTGRSMAALSEKSLDCFSELP
jgi:hypothetical protein